MRAVADRIAVSTQNGVPEGNGIQLADSFCTDVDHRTFHCSPLIRKTNSTGSVNRQERDWPGLWSYQPARASLPHRKHAEAKAAWKPPETTIMAHRTGLFGENLTGPGVSLSYGHRGTDYALQRLVRLVIPGAPVDWEQISLSACHY